MRPLRSLLVLAVAGAAVLSGSPALATPSGSPATKVAATTSVPTAATARADHWRPRAADFPGTVVRRDLAIPMSDGTVLRGDLMLPAGADGAAASGRFPVIVTITAYNKTVLASSPLGGGSAAYLVRRGYAQLTVDARGTGSSAGQWGAFSAREK